VVDAGGPPGSVIAPALLTAAKGDLTTAYNDAAGRPGATAPPFLNPGGGNIGGLNLAPGIYTFSSTASISGSDVTLTGAANDVWIFQIPSDLNVGSGIHVILAGGAQARNIFWQVGDIATIGTTAAFKGTILASQSITMNTSSTMDGRLLAFSAGVTFNANAGNIPTPAAPNFTNIFVTATNSVTLVLNTTPYFLATLQASTNLSMPNWTLVATNNPVTNLWTFTDTNVMLTVPARFYRAFLTIP
jgi:Ice-binding-like